MIGMSQEEEKMEIYPASESRFELNLGPADQNKALTSIAISLKRIADAMPNSTYDMTYLADKIKAGIETAINNGMPKE